MRPPFRFVVLLDSLFEVVGVSNIVRPIGTLNNVNPEFHGGSCFAQCVEAEGPDEQSEEGLRD